MKMKNKLDGRVGYVAIFLFSEYSLIISKKYIILNQFQH